MLKKILTVLLFIAITTIILRFVESGSIESFASIHAMAIPAGPAGSKPCQEASNDRWWTSDPTASLSKACPDACTTSKKFEDVVPDKCTKGCTNEVDCTCGWNNSVFNSGEREWAGQDLMGKKRAYKYPNYYGYGTPDVGYGTPYYTRVVDY